MTAPRPSFHWRKSKIVTSTPFFLIFFLLLSHTFLLIRCFRITFEKQTSLPRNLWVRDKISNLNSKPLYTHILHVCIYTQTPTRPNTVFYYITSPYPLPFHTVAHAHTHTYMKVNCIIFVDYMVVPHSSILTNNNNNFRKIVEKLEKEILISYEGIFDEDKCKENKSNEGY